MTYIVTFEPVLPLVAAVITKQLETFPAHCQIHAYAWAVSTDWNAVQVRDYLMKIAPTAKIFVVRSGTEAAWFNSYGANYDEWLKKYL